MYKASPRVVIPEFTKTAADGVEAVGDVQFVSFGTSYQRMRHGRATPTNGPFGEVGWQLADRGRIVFTAPTLGGTVSGATLELLGKDADDNVFVIGTSTLENGAFPAIEFDITYEQYGLRMAAIDGGGAEVTVTAAAQYFYRAGLATV